MSNLSSFIDATGQMSQQQVTEQDIQNIMTEFNRFQNQTTGGNITQSQQNIIVFDNSTNRVLIGYQTVLQAWGMFVSKVGVDVTTATADQLIFNSNQNIFKVVKTLTGNFGTVVLTTPANTSQVGQNVVTIPHGLNFIPVVFAYGNIFIYNGGSYIQQYSSLPYTDFAFYGTTQNNYRVITYTVVADATNIYATMTVNSSATTTLTNSNYVGGPFKVYLLQETAN